MMHALVLQCKAVLFQLKANGYVVQLMWITSHVAIYLKETADKLGKEALQHNLLYISVDSEVTLSFQRVEGISASK